MTQLMTALPAAVRARLPMVVFAGESPVNAKFYNQYIDQAPLVTATGAHYIAAHSVPRMMDYVREAFHIAKYERCPVVLGIPYDLQKVEYMANQPYETSAMYQPKVGRMQPDPEILAEAVERLAAAQRPIILGGRGVLWSGARDAVIRLADRCGALLSNTLPARGLFHDHPFGLGTTGSYFTSLGREMYESADVVLAVGTSLSYYVGGGHYFAKACKIQLDDAPRGLRDGQKAADIYLRSDALIGVQAILAGLDKTLGVGQPTAAAIRSKEVAHRIATEPADSMPFDIAPGVLDPREVIRAIDAVVPKDWDIVVGGGHQAYFNTQMRGRPAERYVTVREFGAVGNGLSYALGVAAARRQGREGNVVLFEGDGGLLFHIQELETLKRYGFRILICAMNDGGYGSEFHKLRADGLDDSLAMFGRQSLLMLWTAPPPSARAPWMWALIRLPRFGGATYPNGHDNRSGYREVSLSGPRRRRGGECSYSPAAQATLRDDLLPEAIAVPGRYRSLRLVASLVARTPGDWPSCASDAGGFRG